MELLNLSGFINVNDCHDYRQYYFKLVIEHFVKSTKTSWHASDPSPFLAMPGIRKRLSRNELKVKKISH